MHSSHLKEVKYNRGWPFNRWPLGKDSTACPFFGSCFFFLCKLWLRDTMPSSAISKEFTLTLPSQCNLHSGIIIMAVNSLLVSHLNIFLFPFTVVIILTQLWSCFLASQMLKVFMKVRVTILRIHLLSVFFFKMLMDQLAIYMKVLTGLNLCSLFGKQKTY